MDDSQITKIEDVRQSDGWGKYLRSLGWRTTRTSKGTQIALIKSGIINVAKIQRPHSLDLEEIREIEKICRENKCLFVRIEPNIEQNISLLEEEGYYPSPYPLIPPSTIFINLQKSEDDLWDSLSKSGKYSVRRAQREGAKIEFYKNPEPKIVKIFEGISSETAKKKNFGYSSYEELLTKVRAYQDESFILIAKNNNNEITGANFYLGYKGNIWYMHGGTTDIGRKSKAGYELVWQSFLYFKKQGYKFLDLEGRDDDRFPSFTKNWGGFSHFKEKFGGIEAKFPYPQVKLFSPLLKFFSKFYGKIPL